MTEVKTVTDIHEFIRQRPAMYIMRVGSGGLSYLLGELIHDSAVQFSAREIRIDIAKSGKIRLKLRSAHIDIHLLGNLIAGTHLSRNVFSLSIAACLALSTSSALTLGRKNYRINSNGVIRPALKSAKAFYREMTFTFTPDKKTFGSTGPEGITFYQYISETALTNPGVKIILRSDYTKPFTQMVVHTPKGMQDQLDLQASKQLGRSYEHCVSFNEGGIRGEVGWFYPPHRYYPGASDGVIAFANGRSTPEGKSHVEGVIEGIRDAVHAMVTGREDEY